MGGLEDERRTDDIFRGTEIALRMALARLSRGARRSSIPRKSWKEDSKKECGKSKEEVKSVWVVYWFWIRLFFE